MIEMKGLKCKGTVRVYDKDSGKLLFSQGNMFMNTALDQIAKWVAGDATIKIPTVVKVGNSNAAVAMGQLALSGEVLGTKNHRLLGIRKSVFERHGTCVGCYGVPG